MDAHPFFRLLPATLMGHVPILGSLLPKTYLLATKSTPLLPAHEAKMFCSLLLAAMLATKTLLPLLNAPPVATKLVTKPSANSSSLKEKKSQ